MLDNGKSIISITYGVILLWLKRIIESGMPAPFITETLLQSYRLRGENRTFTLCVLEALREFYVELVKNGNQPNFSCDDFVFGAFHHLFVNNGIQEAPLSNQETFEEWLFQWSFSYLTRGEHVLNEFCSQLEREVGKILSNEDANYSEFLSYAWDRWIVRSKYLSIIQAFKNMDAPDRSLAQTENFRKFIRTCLSRDLQSYYRKKNGKRQLNLVPILSSEENAEYGTYGTHSDAFSDTSIPSPEESVSSAEEEASLLNCLDHFRRHYLASRKDDTRQRNIRVFESRIEGCSPNEVADTENISKISVNTITTRMRKSLLDFCRSQGCNPLE